MEGVIQITCDWNGERKPLTVTDRVARELGVGPGDVVEPRVDENGLPWIGRYSLTTLRRIQTGLGIMDRYRKTFEILGENLKPGHRPSSPSP